MNHLRKETAEELHWVYLQKGSLLKAFHAIKHTLSMHEVEPLGRFCQFVDQEIGGCTLQWLPKMFLCWKHKSIKPAREYLEWCQYKVEKLQSDL